jgi:hypothetical protein
MQKLRELASGATQHASALKAPAGRLRDYLGGGLTRAAATGLWTALFLIAFGMHPAEWLASLWHNPPAWLMSGWTRLTVLVVGLVLLGASLRFNVWSQQQRAIDDLSEELSWAIRHLLNQKPRPETDDGIAEWEARFRGWCEKVSGKLDNRAFFTRTDQLHFDRLGFVDPISMSGHQRLDWLLSQLRMKFERLRDVINWTQQRRRP